jgi:hypothetical protein
MKVFYFDLFQLRMLNQDHKMALALAVREKKIILFSKVSPGITNKLKASTWMTIMGQLNALGAHIENVNQIRDTEWGNMKRIAKSHFLVNHDLFSINGVDHSHNPNSSYPIPGNFQLQ